MNVAGTLTLAERLIVRGMHVLFISSDKVFDGSTAHVPAEAPTAPVSEYGPSALRVAPRDAIKA